MKYTKSGGNPGHNIKNICTEPLMLSLLICAHVHRHSLYQCTSRGKVPTTPHPLPAGRITSATKHWPQRASVHSHFCLCVFVKNHVLFFEKMQEVRLPVMENSYLWNFRVTKLLIFRPVTDLTYSSTSPFSSALHYELFATTRPKPPVLVLPLCVQPSTQFPSTFHHHQPQVVPATRKQGQDPRMVSPWVEQHNGFGMGSTALLPIHQHLEEESSALSQTYF